MRADLNQILKPINDDLERVNGIIRDSWSDVNGELRSMISHVMSSGKKIRPAMVVIIGKMFHGKDQQISRLAVAIEYLHTATLIHDDIVDESRFRRGSKTIHTIWNENAAVLAGDYLFAKSLLLLSEFNVPRILKIAAKAIGAICRTEIRRMFVTKAARVGRMEYYGDIEAKTASLFAALAEMTGVLVRADERHIELLRAFGTEFGIAFQIMDDVLDFIGNSDATGKPKGNDLMNGLVTLPTILYLEKADDDKIIRDVLDGDCSVEQVQTAVNVVRESVAIHETMREAEAHVAACKKILAVLPDNQARQMLSAAAQYVIDRNK